MESSIVEQQQNKEASTRSEKAQAAEESPGTVSLNGLLEQHFPMEGSEVEAQWLGRSEQWTRWRAVPPTLAALTRHCRDLPQRQRLQAQPSKQSRASYLLASISFLFDMSL